MNRPMHGRPGVGFGTGGREAGEVVNGMGAKRQRLGMTWPLMKVKGCRHVQTGRPLTVYSQPGEPEPEPKRIQAKKRPRPPAEDPPEHLLCRAFLQSHTVPQPKAMAMPNKEAGRSTVILPPRLPESTTSASSSISGGTRYTWSVRKMPPPKK